MEFLVLNVLLIIVILGATIAIIADFREHKNDESITGKFRFIDTKIQIGRRFRIWARSFRSNHWTGRRKYPGKPLLQVRQLDRREHSQVILEALRREGTIPERIGEKGTWESL